MAYRGKPSTGCQKCRSRKVKCDEAKPVCDRCQRSGHHCIYRDAFDLVHRNQTRSAEQQARSKWRERSARTTQSSSSPSSEPLSSRSTHDEGLLQRDVIFRYVNDKWPLPQALLRPSLHELAALRFYYDFINSADKHYPQRGAFEPLPKLYSTVSPQSCLYSALSATSYANFGGRFRCEETKRAGALYYGKALKLLGTAMADPVRAKTTETLLSALLLGIYESLTSPVCDGSWVTHMVGSESIFKLRGPQFTGGFSDSRLSFMVWGHTIMRHFGFQTHPPAYLRSITETFPKSEPKGALMRLVFDAAETCAVLRDIERAQRTRAMLTSSAPIAHLLARAKTLDADLAAWREDLSPQWSCATYPLNASTRTVGWIRELFDRPGAPTKMHIYTGAFFGNDWNFWRVARLNLNIAMLDVAILTTGLLPAVVDEVKEDEEDEILGDEYTADIVATTAATTALDLIENVIASVPQAVQITPDGHGDPARIDEISGMRGYHIFWPLFNVLRCFSRPVFRERAPPGTEDWVKHVMTFLYREICIAKAEAYRRLHENEMPDMIYDRPREWWPHHGRQGS